VCVIFGANMVIKLKKNIFCIGEANFLLSILEVKLCKD
jgi:hypothetical protein